MDSLGGTREAGKAHLDNLGRHQEGRKGPFGQPGGTREAPGAVKGNPVLLEVRMTVEGFPPQF